MSVCSSHDCIHSPVGKVASCQGPRSPLFEKKKKKKRNTQFQIKGIFDGIRYIRLADLVKASKFMIGPF